MLEWNNFIQGFILENTGSRIKKPSHRNASKTPVTKNIAEKVSLDFPDWVIFHEKSCIL